jgi:hypothetical protein
MTDIIDPWLHVRGVTLADLEQRPEADEFSETLWIINETEHGSASPERLYGFAHLLAHPARTEALDESFLTPYLLRYMWEVPHPLYARQAWLTLKVLVQDASRLQAVVAAVLAHHPLGDVRAAVLQPCEDYHWPDHLCKGPLVKLAAQLLKQDSHPGVRIACVALLAHAHDSGGKADLAWAKLLQSRMLRDESEEVRAAAFVALMDWRGDRQQTFTVLAQAMRQPNNARVLPQLLSASTGNWLQSADMTGCAAVFDALAAQRAQPSKQAHPLFADLCAVLAWLLSGLDRPDSTVLKHWLDQAPFASGEALQARLQAQGEESPVECQAAALAVLHKFKPMSAAERDRVLTFLLHTPQTEVSLGFAAQIYGFWNHVFTLSAGSVEAAQARFEALHAMALAVHAREANAPAEQAKVQDRDQHRDQRPDQRFRTILYERTLAYALLPSLPQVAAQQLMDTVFRAIAADPGLDSSPFYPLAQVWVEDDSHGAPLAERNWKVLVHSIDTMADRHLAQMAATSLVERYAKTSDEAILQTLEAWLAPPCEIMFASELVAELPDRNDPSWLKAHKKRVVAAVKKASAAAQAVLNANPELQSDQWIVERLLGWLND